VNESTDRSFEYRMFSNPNPIFSLMQMASKNHASTRYLTVEENFLMAAIHVAAMKHIQFAEGTLPDLPSDMPSVPPGWVFFPVRWSVNTNNLSSGFQDEESYERFVIEYHKFIANYRVEGCNSSVAHVGSRSPLQLALMISPLYLLMTLRLCTKSFHRRTLIDISARLGRSPQTSSHLSC
jgi:hypothetical protein